MNILVGTINFKHVFGLHFLDTLVKKLETRIYFEKLGSATMIRLLVSIKCGFLEFKDIFKPQHIPL